MHYYKILSQKTQKEFWSRRVWWWYLWLH